VHLKLKLKYNGNESLKKEKNAAVGLKMAILNPIAVLILKVNSFFFFFFSFAYVLEMPDTGTSFVSL